MVTKAVPGRLALAKRSIACYLRQSYAERELVIIVDGDEASGRLIEDHVATLDRRDIRIVRATSGETLGRLRNHVRESARGELVCVWDDDDFHHPSRLETQVRVLREQNAIAVFLSEALHLFSARGELYWTHWQNTIQKCLPGSGLFRRDVAARYPETGPESLRGEDTVFVLRLLDEGRVHMLADAAQLYMYVSHGINTSGDEHHQMLARTLAVSRGRLLKRLSAVNDALDQAVRAGAEIDRVRLLGSNGEAGVWNRAAS